MRRLMILAAFAATAALPAAAAAEGTPTQTISVNGTGGAAVPAGAGNATQQAAYDQALTGAISDAKAKAGQVAGQLGLTLGAVQSFTEESDDYLGYCGVGFVAAPESAVVGVRSSSPASSGSSNLTRIPPKRRKKKVVHKPTVQAPAAHKASSEEERCQVEADVTIVYAIG